LPKLLRVSLKVKGIAHQKDTMDRGAWTTTSERKDAKGLIKKKSKIPKKCKMAWEWYTWIFCLHMYDPVGPKWSLVDDEVNMKLIFVGWRVTPLHDFEILFPFPKLDYPQWLTVHIFSIWEIRCLEIQHVVLLLNSMYLRNKFVQRSRFTR